MNIALIVFIAAFFIIAAIRFYFGMKEAEKKYTALFEDSFRYASIHELEDMVEEMKANGAGPDAPFYAVDPVKYLDWKGDDE